MIAKLNPVRKSPTCPSTVIVSLLLALAWINPSVAQDFAITQQPQNQVAVWGDTVTFSVEVSGGAVNYQWLLNELNIPGATNKTYSFVISPFANQAGSYRVRVYNGTGILTSEPATLAVYLNSRNPAMVSAVVMNPDTIDIVFDVPPNSNSVSPTNHLRVIRSGTSGASANVATIAATLVSGRIVRLKMGSDFDPANCYYVQAHSVASSSGDFIAADSVIGLILPGAADPCPIPPDPPLDLLQLSIEKQANDVKLSWPAGYHGFAIEQNVGQQISGSFLWLATSLQSNGVVLPLEENRLFRLKKVP